jgi:hypothetical protein
MVATSSAATVALAGCSGGGGADTSSPEAVVESYYDVVASDTEAARDLFHSESPSLQREPNVNASEVDVSYDNVEVTLVSENLSESELREEFPVRFRRSGGSAAFSDELKTAVIEENAIVEASYKVSGEQGTRQLTTKWLTTTEDGDWQIAIADTTSEN